VVGVATCDKGVPAMMILLYGYALNFDIRHVRLVVQDRDHSVESRGLVAATANYRMLTKEERERLRLQGVGR
jgi:hypothetical protein